jgi:hypothetical protein
MDCGSAPRSTHAAAREPLGLPIIYPPPRGGRVGGCCHMAGIRYNKHPLATLRGRWGGRWGVGEEEDTLIYSF